MANDLVAVNIEQLTKIKAGLKKVGQDIGKVGTDAAANYLLNVLITTEIPPYKYYSRAKAYPDAPAGPGWFSPKQRRWFFWALSEGMIETPYQRTGKLQGAWKFLGSKGAEQGAQPASVIIVNGTDYAKWIYSKDQARQIKGAGWRKIDNILKSYKARIFGAFERAVEQEIKKQGLGAGQ